LRPGADQPFEPDQCGEPGGIGITFASREQPIRPYKFAGLDQLLGEINPDTCAERTVLRR
jgi:hypothetical protein